MSDSQAQVNPRKLFVGNMPYSASEQQLTDLFVQYGELVEVKVISDRMTGRPKGIAFVEYVNEEDATKAVEALNGYELDGRALVVNVARPFQPRPRTSGGGGYNDRRGGGSSFGGGGGYGRDSRGGGRSNDRRSSY